jgi:hypothetical protein
MNFNSLPDHIPYFSGRKEVIKNIMSSFENTIILNSVSGTGKSAIAN